MNERDSRIEAFYSHEDRNSPAQNCVHHVRKAALENGDCHYIVQI